MKPMQETSVNKKGNAVKIIIAIAIGLVVLGLGVFIAKNPNLFKAELTQVGPTPENAATNRLYIPDDYTATSPQANNTISVKVGDPGIGNECIRGVTADFSFDPAKIQFDASPLTIASAFGGNALAPDVSLTSPSVLHVVFTGANPVHFDNGATVFSLTLKVLDDLPADTTTPSISISVPSVAVSVKPYTGTACGTGNSTSQTLTSIATGKIKIVAAPCQSGYERVGGSPDCTDINECTNGTATCGTNSTCTNTPAGSYTCACNAGYSGANGRNCADTNACVRNPCPSGYACADKAAPTFLDDADGRTCTDINECLTNHGGCASNATCENTEGSRTCTCPLSYTGDGTVCTAPVLTNVTNCPASLLAGSNLKARPNMLLKGPAGGLDWKLDGGTANIVSASDGASAMLSNVSVGDHSVVAHNGAPCTFTVDCYTSIDVANARKAIGSTDPAKLLLYDFDSDGKIDATDKKAIYEASKSCN